ncbi:hypothetical protein C5167_012935 [Papaver somniferum]|uniref:Major facilitator superfamily (MFS) profile domain-containing protein n=1 Tax=Papaver somniferum TaxID=3469 RepID=A0A4Y7J2W6_PAPSO|nr:hypothetical protein C5167_012935 [Papaver somniferum]
MVDGPAGLIIIVDIAECMAYYGISANLITYLTGPLGQSTVAAAANVNTWVGFIWMLPVFGAVVADSFLGRFRTIIISTLIYVLGLGLPTLSVVLPSLIGPRDCLLDSNSILCTFPSFQLLEELDLNHVYKHSGLINLMQEIQRNVNLRAHFFNWWYFGICLGSSISRLFLTYIQDNVSWSLGFGISTLSLAVALIVFLLGTQTYRYSVKRENENPILRITQALINPINSTKNARQCSIAQVEDEKMTLRLVPIWISCLIYAVVFAQSTTFFVKQGNTMDRSIGTSFQIPAAALQILINVSIFIFIPLYDVPIHIIHDVFATVGLQEFFYDQVPDSLRSIGISLYLSVLGVGSFLSGSLISIIEHITGGSSSHYSWFSNNLNRAHLDYFYWLLAGLSLVELVAFLYLSTSYLYKRGTLS